VTSGPENTMYNFRRCVWEYSTQILETDLQLTSDGHLILLHDSSVNRTTNGCGEAGSMTLEEIRKLDAAVRYPTLVGQGIQIPTFEEFLDEFVPTENLVFFLDFKEEEAVFKTMEIVQERGIQDRVILGSVASEANRVLGLLKNPTMPLITDAQTTISLVTSYMMGGFGSYEMQHDIVGYILSPQTQMFFSKGLVDAIHNKGCRFLITGIDTPAQQQQCIDWGVDFILSDRPDILTETLTKHRQQ